MDRAVLGVRLPAVPRAAIPCFRASADKALYGGAVLSRQWVGPEKQTGSSASVGFGSAGTPQSFQPHAHDINRP